ncbi:MAG: hypothetical protein CVU42_04315 [Chloroflexi bacterium HGW-Chloroflexi-4]|jgi:hypothetical protein|nr:MAG: hypothetical protein CVU42_04315 [Chloroflexi bacterium HGW-Chloroflexi-4]
MFKNKPVTLLIASALMVVLIVLTMVFQFVGGSIQFGMPGGGPGGSRGDFQPGQIPDGANLPEGFTPPEGGMPPSGNGDFQPGSDVQGNFTGMRVGFNGSSTTMKLLQLLRGVQIGAAILIALLGILSVVGMLLSKAWGRKWAIAAAIFSLVALIPSFFMMRFGSTLIITLLKLALAAAVLVLCFIPTSKQAPAEA